MSLDAVIPMPSMTKNLYGADNADLVSLCKMVASNQPEEGIGSNRTDETREISPPLKFDILKALPAVNEVHGACLGAKVAATVGIGFISEEEKKARKEIESQGPNALGARITLEKKIGEPGKVDEVLDPFCLQSFQDTLHDVAEDYHTLGNGALECVYSDERQLQAIYHVPFEGVTIVVEKINNQLFHHYKIKNSGMYTGGQEKLFANFGDAQGLKARQKLDYTPTEIIHFRKPSARSKYYGRPDYLSALSSIDLAKCRMQMAYDFFNNRGVPEGILLLKNHGMTPQQIEEIKKAMLSSVSLGNWYKSLLLSLNGETADAKYIPLMGETPLESLRDMHETLSMSIVTAHRVPHMLAGVLIPGKIAAANELPNALLTFQILVIQPSQNIIRGVLARTLGGPMRGTDQDSQPLGLEPGDFELRRIVDGFNMNNLDTMSRMREPVATGRDPSKGLKD